MGGRYRARLGVRRDSVGGSTFLLRGGRFQCSSGSLSALVLAAVLAGGSVLYASENAGRDAMVEAICICWPTMGEGGWEWECWCP